MTSKEMRERAQKLASCRWGLEADILHALADLTDEVRALRKLVERHDHRVGSLDESPWYTSDPRFRDD
jgi:hypothetical protein